MRKPFPYRLTKTNTPFLLDVITSSFPSPFIRDTWHSGRLVPLDYQPLIESTLKTGKVLIVEEDNLRGGWGAEIAARLSAECFCYLDAPITRIAAPDTPLPCASSLEAIYLPTTKDIVETALKLVDECRLSV